MKKVLSIVLTLALAFSLLCTVPASADGAEHSFPYIFVNFEDGQSLFKSTNEVSTEIVSGGMGGFGYAQKLVNTSTVGGSATPILKDSSGGYLTYTASAGEEFKMTMWVKLHQKLASGAKMRLFLDVQPDPNIAIDINIDPTNLGWQKVEFKHTFTAQTVIANFQLRPGSGSSMNFVEGENASTANPTDRIYYIDDVEISVTKPTEGASALGGMLYENDFSEADSINNIALYTDDPNATPNFSKTRISGASDGPAAPYTTSNYLRLTDNDASRRFYIDFPLEKSVELGKYYRFRMDIRVNSVTAPASWNSGETSRIRGIFGNDNTQHTLYIPLDRTWSTYEIIYHPVAADEVASKIKLWLWINVQGNGSNMASWDIANMEFCELSPVEMGDFELSGGSMKMLTNKSSQNITSLKWETEANTTVEYRKTNSLAVSGGKYGGAFYWTGGANNAKIYDSDVTLEAGKNYTLSGSMAAVGADSIYPVTVGIDWGTSISNTDDAELVLGKVMPNATSKSEFSFTFSAPTTGELSTGVTAPKAKLYFTMLTADAGKPAYASSINVDRVSTQGNLGVYIDGISLEASADVDYPMVSNISAFGEAIADTTVNLEYDFVIGTGDSDISAIKLMADGANPACLAVYRAGDTVTIPETAQGKTIYIEIVPISSAKTMGTRVTVFVLPEFEYTFALGEFTTEGDITANVAITSNNTQSSDVKALLVVILYDSDNGIVKYDSKPISCTAGGTMSDALTVTGAVSDTNLPAVTKAKAFLWAVDDISTATIFNINMVPVAPAQTRTK